MRQQFLTDEDFANLYDFEANGKNTDKGRKPEMRRLTQLGVVYTLGFGRFHVSAFGRLVLDTEEGKETPLPILTHEQWLAARK